MTLADILTTVRDELAAWARLHRGSAEVAGDVDHMYGILSNKPGGLRAVVLFSEETKRGEHEEAGVVDIEFLVVISRGRGFTLPASDSLVSGSGGGRPLFDLVQEARDVVRGINFVEEETEFTADYKGTTLFQYPTEVPVDAYQLRFTLGLQMEEPVFELQVNAGEDVLAVDDAETSLAI
jgi:hypothetical protein